MARLFVGASTQYLLSSTGTGQVAGVYPASVSLWALSSNAGQGQGTLYSEGKTSTQNTIFRIACNGSKVGLFIRDDTNTTVLSVDSTATPWNGTWRHIALTMDASRNYQLYVDGSTDVSGTISAGTFSSPNTKAIAALVRMIVTNTVDANIGDVATWTRVLSAGEVAALARGARPSMFPTSLNRFWPVFGIDSPEIELVAQDTMALTNSPTIINSPPTYPSLLVTTRFGKPSTVAAAATTAPRRALLGVGI